MAWLRGSDTNATFERRFVVACGSELFSSRAALVGKGRCRSLLKATGQVKNAFERGAIVSIATDLSFFLSTSVGLNTPVDGRRNQDGAASAGKPIRKITQVAPALFCYSSRLALMSYRSRLAASWPSSLSNSLAASGWRSSMWRTISPISTSPPPEVLNCFGHSEHSRINGEILTSFSEGAGMGTSEVAQLADTEGQPSVGSITLAHLTISDAGHQA